MGYQYMVGKPCTKCGRQRGSYGNAAVCYNEECELFEVMFAATWITEKEH